MAVFYLRCPKHVRRFASTLTLGNAVNYLAIYRQRPLTFRGRTVLGLCRFVSHGFGRFLDAYVLLRHDRQQVGDNSEITKERFRFVPTSPRRATTRFAIRTVRQSCGS